MGDLSDYFRPIAERNLTDMTHWPEAPNPAQPYLDAARNFAQGGLSQAFKGAGVQLPDWSNRVGDVLQSDTANTAIGMTSPLKGVRVGTGMAGLRNRLEEKYAATRRERQKMNEWIEQIGGTPSQGLPPISPEYKTTLSGRLVRSSPEPQPSAIAQGSESTGPSWLDIARGKTSPLKGPGFKAFHGSPHDFERFDVGKSNQGLWFSQDPDLAKHYGQLYEVNINAPQESFINRNAPIGQQSQQVREAIAGIGKDFGIPARENGDGGSFYADLARKLAADGPYREGLLKANDLLRERGIPGITDGQAHVVFDDKLIDILKK